MCKGPVVGSKCDGLNGRHQGEGGKDPFPAYKTYFYPFIHITGYYLSLTSQLPRDLFTVSI